MGKPNLPDVNTLIRAGIDPKTGLPIKFGDVNGSGVKQAIYQQLKVVDRQDALNRFTWYNVPQGLDANLIERILYYRGQGMFFYIDTNKSFYFLPYALDGSIDVYGRYNSVTPLPFAGGTTTDDGKKPKPWIEGLKRDVAKEIILPEDLTYDDLMDKCVILRDYSIAEGQEIIPRSQLQDGILDSLAECIPFLNTALQNSTGIQGMRVNGQEEYSNVEAASRSTHHAALSGKRFIPIISNIELQDLAAGEVAKAEEFLLAMQSLDNYRLSLYGLDNGGLFQKKAHMLQEEEETNNGNVGLIMRDCLQQRQEFCNIVNSIWGLGMWCEPSEVVLNMDRDGDGTAGSDEEGNSPAKDGGESDGSTVE